MLNQGTKKLIKKIVEAVEKLNYEKDEVQQSINSAFGEAKKHGLDIGVLKKLISIRKRNQKDLFEKEELLKLYKGVLGMADGEEIPEIDFEDVKIKEPKGHNPKSGYNPDRFHTSGTELDKDDGQTDLEEKIKEKDKEKETKNPDDKAIADKLNNEVLAFKQKKGKKTVHKSSKKTLKVISSQAIK